MKTRHDPAQKVYSTALPEGQHGKRAARGSEDVPASSEQAFEALWPRLVAFFTNQGLPSDEVEDLAQTTLLRVFENLESYRFEGPFYAWLRRVATNVLKNHLRDRATLKRSAQETSLEALDEVNLFAAIAEPEAEERTLARERRHYLRKAVADLPPRMRRVLLLRLQGLDYREIAEMMEVSVDTVKVQMHKARLRLRTAING